MWWLAAFSAFSFGFYFSEPQDVAEQFTFLAGQSFTLVAAIFLGFAAIFTAINEVGNQIAKNQVDIARGVIEGLEVNPHKARKEPYEEGKIHYL